jgi:hypothetical protein
MFVVEFRPSCRADYGSACRLAGLDGVSDRGATITRPATGLCSASCLSRANASRRWRLLLGKSLIFPGAVGDPGEQIQERPNSSCAPQRVHSRDLESMFLGASAAAPWHHHWHNSELWVLEGRGAGRCSERGRGPGRFMICGGDRHNNSTGQCRSWLSAFLASNQVCQSARRCSGQKMIRGTALPSKTSSR